MTGLNVMSAWLGIGLLFAAVPASSNFTLKSYDFGTGGTGASSSTNYRLNGVTGTQSGAAPASSTNYGLGTGVNNTSDSGVPPAPTFTNADSTYDRLKLVINTGGNPADTKYLIAISADSFATTQYVQADTSVGSSQAVSNYQTYAVWGGATGFSVSGLAQSTTYQVKVKAMQGNFTGSAFGPVASAATITPTVSVSLTTSLTSTPPFTASFSNLIAGSVANGNADVIIGLTSNAANGGSVYVRGANAGLLSSSTSNSIASASADLSVAGFGYGAQVTSVGQTLGGPLSKRAPFAGASNNVGGISTSLQPILTTDGPLTSGAATVRLMAKPASTTLSANDYADILTLVVAMEY